MSKHIKEMLVITWALSAQPQPKPQRMQGEAVLMGTTQNQALNTLHTETSITLFLLLEIATSAQEHHFLWLLVLETQSSEEQLQKKSKHLTVMTGPSFH